MKVLEDIKNTLAKDVMESSVVTNTSKDTIANVSHAISIANTSESIVVDEKGNVLGIVTLRDIVRAIGNGIDPKQTVDKIMTTKVIVCNENDPVEDVLIKMAKNNIARVPVLNDNNEIIGIVSEKSLLKVIPSLYEILEEEISINEEEVIVETKEKLREGICENCEQFSEELIEVDGRLLCKECYEEMYE